MNQIKGILFDFNGTLFFDSEYHLGSFYLCYEKYGLPNPGKEFITNKIFGMSNKDICNRFFIPNATEEQIADFTAFKENTYKEMCLADPDRCHLSDDVCEMLDFLKEHSVPFCIATGSPLENVDFYFKTLGLDRWFTLDNLVYSDGTFAGKPEPDIYLLAAKRLGLAPSDCVVFEDGTMGITAANAAGAAKVIAVWEEGYPSPLNGSVRVDGEYHSFAEWRKILSDIELI